MEKVVKNILSEFLEKYYKLDINDKGYWCVKDVMGFEMNYKDFLSEISMNFGGANNTFLLIRVWIDKNKKTITRPIIDYLNNYAVKPTNYGWSVSHKKNGNPLKLNELDSFDYTETQIKTIYNEWLYDEKCSHSGINV